MKSLASLTQVTAIEVSAEDCWASQTDTVILNPERTIPDSPVSQHTTTELHTSGRQTDIFAPTFSLLQVCRDEEGALLLSNEVGADDEEVFFSMVTQ